ncbi:expressed protein [Cryptococcus deneoformans JEC21]|uniref:Expressed protein n=2 Tax=Cryptococcus deneoformans TaxID=40410 RepID=Q5KAA0_CRYD1|nr:expressed protein [Cryptococcus neoformans var. neoformans JEC21]AAW46020.2 expressed protein [Cryptococcus neoformans var. neoformans JEC21]
MVTFAQGGEATAAVDMVASIPVNIKKELRFSCLLKPYLVLLDAAVQKGRKTWETLVENASVTQDLPPAWRLKVMEIDERSPFSRHDGSLVGEYNSAGVCLGLPKRIDRPVYSHPDMRDDARRKVLFGDSTHDVRKKTDGDVCSKYFDTWLADVGRTGGIAGMWCPHGICLGYHIMLTAEGRNDFFSMLRCFRKTAPKIVIYDYACHLGPLHYPRSDLL